MPTIQSSIETALFTRLASLTFSPALPVAWPNMSFDPPSPPKYLRPTLVPNTAQQITLGDEGQNRHVGLFQVSVFWPLNVGVSAAVEVAGKVAEHFKRGTVMTADDLHLRVYRPPVVNQALVEDTAIHIPVTVSWLCDAANPS